jgi:3-dehydroquinate dehydratase I
MHSTVLSTLRKPAIVAVIGSLPDFEAVRNLAAGQVDLCELRIDLLYRASADLEESAGEVPCPKIATVRDPEEGGANGLSEQTRLELYQRWLPWCDLIDVELRNLNRFSGLIEEAESSGKGVIVSFHDFEKTPSLGEFQEILDRSRLKKTQIFKVASKVAQWSEVETLIQLLQQNPESRIAAMGMGEFGKLSRLVLARLGSHLVYGSVGEAVVPGQWPVKELARLLSEMTNGN